MSTEYEFTAEQNETFRKSARLATSWGVVALLFAALVALDAVTRSGIVTDWSLSWLERMHELGLYALPPAVVGVASLEIGRRLIAVVKTEGSDITHGVSAMSAIGWAFVIQAMVLIGGVLLTG